MSRGEVLVGKKIAHNERFLLDLAAKMTINQMKGITSGFSPEEIEEMKKTHKEMAQAGTIQTPPDKFYDDMIKLNDGTTFKHPLSYPSEYYYEQNKKKPDDPDAPNVIPEDDEDNYLVNQVDKMLGTD
jgi:hypothetical protein